MTYAPITGKCPVCHNDSANSAFQAGAASRDAEVAKANSVSELGHALFAKQLIENDQLREQVKLLREALLPFRLDSCAADDAIKATEPKP